MNKYLLLCFILSAACRLEASPMRLGEGSDNDPSRAHTEQKQEEQRRESYVAAGEDDHSDQILRGNDAALAEEKDLELGFPQQSGLNNITSRLKGAAKEMQSALNRPDVSRLFVPAIPERTWGEYLQQSFVEARAHEQAVAILQEVDVTMDQSLRHAHEEAEEAYQAVKQYQDSGPTVVETTTRDQLEAVITAAEQTAQQLKMAKDPSAYTLYLAEAIAQMLENTKVRDLPQVNEDGTYQDVELRDRWELDQKLVSRLAVPSAATYTLYGILSEAAEQALLDTIVNRISDQSHGVISTLEELFSDESITAAADVATMARLAVVEAENVNFCIAKAQGPRAGAWHADPSRELLALSRRLVESSQRARAAVNKERKDLFFNRSAQGPLIKEVTDSIIAYRKQNKEEHAQYLKKMQSQGDLCHSDPYFDFECSKKIRRSIQQHYDVALRKQIEARLAGLPLMLSYSHESIVDENQWHQEQLQSMREMLQDLGMNCPRYRGPDNGSENLIRFIYSVSRGTEAPDFSYAEITDYTRRELEAAAANYRETEPASLIRMLLEISIANALPDLIDDVNADIAVKNGKIYAEYERQEFYNLCLGVNSALQSTHVITTDERSSLSNAANSIMFSTLPMMGNTVPVERNWRAIERLQQFLTEKDITNDSSIDLLLAMRRIMTPDQVPGMVQAAKGALPVVQKLFQYCQQQPVTPAQAPLIAQTAKLTKALKAAAGLLDDQGDASEGGER